MRGQVSNSTDPSLDKTRATARRMPGAVGLVAVALLVGSAGPALAGNQGDLILNEFNAVADSDFLRGAVENFVDADVAVADDEIKINNHSYFDQQGPLRLTTTGTLPAGLSIDTDYYIVNSGLTNTPADDWIGLSLTPGGAKVDITGATGGGTHTLTLRHDLGDSFFGVIQGNGGNWIELVVIADHLDIRGWTLEWMNADPDFGSITFQSHDIWSDLRAGTIITIREYEPEYGELHTDLSYDPSRGDWWIHADIDDLDVLAQAGFKVDDDDWRMRIWDGAIDCTTNPSPPPARFCTGVGATVLIQDSIGEGTALWGGGGGVGNDEVGKLEQDPSAAAATAPPVPAYNDGTSSTFGSQNRWAANTLQQDFSKLRPFVLSVPALTMKGTALLVGLLVGSVFWLARRRVSAV